MMRILGLVLSLSLIACRGEQPQTIAENVSDVTTPPNLGQYVTYTRADRAGRHVSTGSIST